MEQEPATTFLKCFTKTLLEQVRLQMQLKEKNRIMAIKGRIVFEQKSALPQPFQPQAKFSYQTTSKSKSMLSQPELTPAKTSSYDASQTVTQQTTMDASENEQVQPSIISISKNESLAPSLATSQPSVQIAVTLPAQDQVRIQPSLAKTPFPAAVPQIPAPSIQPPTPPPRPRSPPSRPQYQLPPLVPPIPKRNPSPRAIQKVSLPHKIIISGMVRLQPYLDDPQVLTLECPGPTKPILVYKGGSIQPTSISFTAEEISNIMQEISEKTKVPIISGIFKAAFDDFVTTAVVSEFVGTRFMIQRKASPQIDG